MQKPPSCIGGRGINPISGVWSFYFKVGVVQSCQSAAL